MPESTPSPVLSALLALLGRSDQPLGAGAAREALTAQGFEVSEATAGRLLRSLEEQGLARKVSVQGRLLTEEGHRLLEETLRDRQRTQSAEALLEVLEPTRRRELADLLVARRAIEGETAALAARNGTAEERNQLRRILDQAREAAVAGRSVAPLDRRFHGLVAAMSRNRVLEAALQLLRQHGDPSPLLAGIRARSGHTTGQDHARILQALEARDPEEARRAMTAHLDNVLADVEATPDGPLPPHLPD